MSKILLINPPFNIFKSNYNTSISVGLLSIASYLKEKGVSVKIIDGIRQKNYKELILKELSDTDFVGLSVMTMQVSSALEISGVIKKRKPNIPIIWGGVHPTLFPKETVNHELVDIAIVGEGEETLWEMIRKNKSKNKKSLLKIESIPLPDWSLMPENILKNITLVPAYTSRGCPSQCSFCINSITCNSWRGYSPEKVLEGLKVIKKYPHFKNKPIRFWDENFFTNIKRAKKIVEEIIKQDLITPWETTIRVDYINDKMVNDEFLSLLKQSGCYLLSYGGESGSERILKKINKGTNPEQIIYSAKQTLKHKIIPQYSFMVGLPGETRSDMGETIKVINKLTKLSPKIQILGPQAFRPYPGSALYKECLESGWKSPQSLDEWANLVDNELNHLSPKKFPWARKNLDLIESLEAYVRFGAHSIKSAMGSTIKSNKLLKFIFVLLCQLRWRLKFFKWPLEIKLARRAIIK